MCNSWKALKALSQPSAGLLAREARRQLFPRRPTGELHLRPAGRRIIYTVPVEEYPFMLRAKKEGRLVGCGFGPGTVMLPPEKRAC